MFLLRSVLNILLYYILNKLGAMTFSLFIDINHVNREKRYRYQVTTCICTLLLMSSYYILTCFFMLDNTIKLTVCVTNIECLLIGVVCYKLSII